MDETRAGGEDGKPEARGDENGGSETTPVSVLPAPAWQMLRWGSAGVLLLVMFLPVVAFHGGGSFGSLSYEYEDKARVWGYTETENGFTCWCEPPATGYWFGLFPLIGSLVMAAGIALLLLNRLSASAVMLGLGLVVFMIGMGEFKPLREFAVGTHSTSLGVGFWLWMLAIAMAAAAAVMKRRDSPNGEEIPEGSRHDVQG